MSNGVKYGLIGGLLSILSGLLFYLLDMSNAVPAQIVGYVIMVGIFIATTIGLKKAQGGYITISDGIKNAVITALIFGAISALWYVVFTKFIDPSVMEKALTEAKMKMEESGLSDNQIKQQMEMTKKFMAPYIVIPMMLVFMSIFGIIIGLITSAIIKNERPEFPVDIEKDI